MEYLPAILTALFGTITSIALAWFNYNQKTKEKMTDYKLEKWKQESEKRSGELSSIYSDIYRKLHSGTIEINADRVYIIQPHPLIDTLFFSVTLEVTHPYRDVTEQKEKVHNRLISKWGWFVKKLQEEYMVYPNVNLISDINSKADLLGQGIRSIVCVKMVDSDGRWIGNLCADFTHRNITEDEIISIKQNLRDKANLIQFKLPEYKAN